MVLLLLLLNADGSIDGRWLLAGVISAQISISWFLHAVWTSGSAGSARSSASLAWALFRL